MKTTSTKTIKKRSVRTASITVTQHDYTKLAQMVQTLRLSKSVDPRYLQFLGQELQGAGIIDPVRITPDFVTMNSVVAARFIGTGKQMQLQLAYPASADFSKGQVSVLSPLGCALLGCRAGDTISFEAPAGTVSVHIDSVLYQPEAHGKDLQ